MELASTRRSLHGIAELVLAGPQYRRAGDIRLQVSPGGFATVTEPDLRVEGVDLVAGDRRIPLAGHTYASLAAEAGVTASPLDDVYRDGPGVPADGTIHVDPLAAQQLAEGFSIGDEALRRFAPDAERVLWSEHFDVGITLDEVNYGVSPGDTYLGEPYAYVGPWQLYRGEFWNAPFGAAHPVRELGDVDAVVDFFREGRRLSS